MSGTLSTGKSIETADEKLIIRIHQRLIKFDFRAEITH